MIRLVVPEIGEEEIAAAVAVLRSGQLVQGERVRDFEQLVAERVGVAHAVAVSSGTAALHLAVLALGIGPGDEVLVPDFTFPATANVVTVAGAKPVLVDVDLVTFNVDAKALERAVTPRTRAIMPVHAFGHPADMEAVLAVARARKLAVIEDAACALGALHEGKPCGSLGDLGCFSFHPRKPITTGEGGMVVTNDAALAERVRRLRSHGMTPAGKKGVFEAAGLNYRLTDFQAALGIGQMRRLDAILEARARVARLYDTKLAALPALVRPRAPGGCVPVWQSYVVLVPRAERRDAILAALEERGVQAAIGTYALSAQPAHAGPRHPNARAAFERSLALPLHGRLSEDDVTTVVEALRDALER